MPRGSKRCGKVEEIGRQTEMGQRGAEMKRKMGNNRAGGGKKATEIGTWME